MNPPNPNNEAWNRETSRLSWKQHEKFRGDLRYLSDEIPEEIINKIAPVAPSDIPHEN